MIATISILLISALIMDVQAAPNEKAAVKISGNSANFLFQDRISGIAGQISISTIEDTGDLSIIYSYQNGANVDFGFLCTASSDSLKISKDLSEGTLNFNTADLDCSKGIKVGNDGIISLTLDGEKTKPNTGKFSFRTCQVVDGVEVCVKKHGTVLGTDATASGTVFGTNMIMDGDMGTEKAIITHSNFE
jgi:hypothetical protein